MDRVGPAAAVEVRPMTDADVAGADHVTRVAFGVYLGVPVPETTFGAADVVGSRFHTSPRGAFVAIADGEVVGAIQSTYWGSFGFFGPLTVHPDLWDRGVARRLLAPVVELFDASPTVLSGLFTFAQSAKHVGLYRSFGYWPGYLTAIMSRVVDPVPAPVEALRYSELSDAERAAAIADCAHLTDRVFAGLDVSVEILATADQELGDTVLVSDDAGVTGLAVCHVNAGEADRGVCFVKFAAARPGPAAHEHFARVLDAVEALARDRGADRVVAGVDTARRDAYRDLLARGFRTDVQGVRMHRPDSLGYGRADAYVIDDLR
jgi:GNAT superfamily N-acetyltransferase